MMGIIWVVPEPILVVLLPYFVAVTFFLTGETTTFPFYTHDGVGAFNSLFGE
jgi:hypothetical protein